MFNFCGLGVRCSIVGGKATSTRGRLVRREALEVALYTFKFVPGVDSIIAFMPPPPGQGATSVLFLRKENFKDALDRPLAETLKLARAAAADAGGHDRGDDDRPAHAAEPLQLRAAGAPDRRRRARARPVHVAPARALAVSRRG